MGFEGHYGCRTVGEGKVKGILGDTTAGKDPLMGLGFGGEWAAGAVLLGEVVRAEHRGKIASDAGIVFDDGDGDAGSHVMRWRFPHRFREAADYF